MTIQPFQEEDPYKTTGTEEAIKNSATKRLRWATHRANPAQSRRKRQSIMDRIHKRSANDKPDVLDGNGDSVVDEGDHEMPEPEIEIGSRRTIYFNVDLPSSARDEEGHPIASYSRNKIRTAKYTPLSFVPKNLYYQFHNIANIYFLFIIILSCFSIFGAVNPGLGAVPLIVIVVITAIKDAIEDFRRTVLDNELNNSPVHRLIDWNNVNTAENNISLWRRFKKANTRGIVWVWKHLKRRKSSKKPGAVEAYAQRATGTRPSIDTRNSISSDNFAPESEHNRSDNDTMEMTPVPSPRPSQDRTASGGLVPGSGVVRNYSYRDRTGRGTSPSGHLAIPADARHQPNPSATLNRGYGNVINPTKTTPEKSRFVKQCWKDVQVGDFVRLYNEEQVPADIVVLASSDPEGACYVETKNLDGETNLKLRHALHCGQKVKRARDCEKAEFWIESEPAHANLYSYSAAARWMQHNSKMPNEPPTEMAEPISINNLLLRGCSVRNTDWVLGVVVFTGAETKIMLNSGITPSKRAKISRDLNWNVIYNFIILFLMCLVAGIVEGIYFGRANTSNTYFGYNTNSGALNGFITFWAAIILFQNLVPISLYITLEIIRTIQAFFIYSDIAMYYAHLDYPCTPKSWNISDDLGQIEYIFSDKTGTLTQNVMEFRKATINGIPYGEAYTEAQAGLQKRQGVDVVAEGARARAQIAKDKVKMIAELREMHDNPYLIDENLTFVAADFVSDLRGALGESQKHANEAFMLVLSLCHTVVTERIPGDPPRIEFKAQSPDEAALVATARDCGFTVLARKTDGLTVNVMGTERHYTVLNTLEFNSSRKRMSAIIKMPDGKIMLFCKGADSMIYSRLVRGQQTELRKQTAEHLEMFAREGLRTLCIAQKELTQEEYASWNHDHEIAAASVDDREDKLEIVADAIERDLMLLGGTAIEDRLQEGVPDAIAMLGNAGIKLWVLTGDKVETAINIGFSCNLLNNDMDMIVIKTEDESLEAAEAILDKHLAVFNMTGSDQELKAAKSNHEPPAPTHAIVIDGDALKICLDTKLRQKFLLLCKQCKSVLCCRVSPAQKAAVVSLVKNGLDVITLAIGDGANDVAMIQEADVGVGIAGEEGRQAVMSSDFAIGQFRFLVRLTLVHGRWCYRRMGETIANFFYKNIVWTFSLFWYQIYSNFDCSYVFDYTYILLYNVAFTSLPIIFMGILDQDVSDKVSMAVPSLYKRGIERKEWTQLKFWIYMCDGLYQSLICFFMAYLLYAPATFNTSEGNPINDNRQMGVFIANVAVIVVNVYILLNTYRWDWLMLLITTISVLLIFGWTGIYTEFQASFQFYKAGAEVYGTLAFWAECLLATSICLLPRFTAKSYQKIFMPREVDIVREQVQLGYFKHLDNENPTLADYEKYSESQTSSEPSKVKSHAHESRPEDEQPFYTASETRTRDRNAHTSQMSDETYDTFATGSRVSHELPIRPSHDRARPSYDRFVQSSDRIRPSFEQMRDFTSAAMLTRVESAHSGPTHLIR